MSKSIDPLKTTTPELHSKGIIILAGDSWALGEFGTGENAGRVMHKGLEQYLIDDGYSVVNKGVGAGSNILAIDNLCEELCSQSLDHENTKAFFFCTDWHRDFRYLYDHLRGVVPWDVGFFSLKNYDEMIGHKAWHKLFKRLEKISNRSKVKIGLIGGCADCITVGSEYQGIYTACASMTNLALEHHQWESPVLSLFLNGTTIVDERTKPSSDLLKDMEIGLARQKVWENNKDWFYPDGVHANRHTHKKLFNFLKQQQYI